MLSLPNIPGDYAVGAATFAIPLHTPQAVGVSRVKATDDYALCLEEISFTAFYPAQIKRTGGREHKKGMHWIARPVKRILHGYAHFGEVPVWPVENFLYPVASQLKIPVYPDAPLLDPSFKGEGHQWPLVIFSHGLGGTRLNYSQTCARIAAMGNVVLAMEHRDGTSPAVTSHCCLMSKKSCKDHPPKIRYYLIPEKDVKWPDGTQPERWAFRSNQLDFRQMEIYLAYKIFADFLISGLRQADTLPLGRIFTIDGAKGADEEAFWASWAPTDSGPRVRYAKGMTFIGHSFGGATAFSILSNPPPLMPSSTERFDALPITHALVLDPWLEPLSSPGPTPSRLAMRGPHWPRILIVNSEEFTLWKDHFTRLEQIVADWREQAVEAATGGSSGNDAPDNGDAAADAGAASPASGDVAANGHASGNAQPHPRAQDEDGEPSPIELLTLVRAKHISFSDFAVISVPPIIYASKAGKKLLAHIGGLALAFMQDGLHEELRAIRTRGFSVEWVARRRTVASDPHRRTHHKRLVGNVGDVIVH